MLNSMIESTRIPVKASIGLGTRINGKMKNETYFVLKNAPEVAAVYGPEPEFLEVMFPKPSVADVAPSDLEYWTGKRDKEGNIVDGELLCSGPGPMSDGTPGVATWKDRNRMPPESDCLGPRDPATGWVKRACRQDGCCDWLDDKGYPKCKQTMRLFFIIPRVSPTNVYRITTHSWKSMREFYNQLLWVEDKEGLAFTPFRLYKEATNIKRWDVASGKELSRVMPILKIVKDDMFLTLYGAEIKEKFKVLREKQYFLGAMAEPEPIMLDAPDDTVVDVEPELTPVQFAQQLLADPDITLAFGKLEDLKGIKFSNKIKMDAILKKKDEPDVKYAVLEALERSIIDALPKEQPQAPEPAAETVGVVEVEVQVQVQALDSIDPLPAG